MMMSSYLSLGGRSSGFFIGGGSRLIGFSPASNHGLRPFAISSCINSYNNATTLAKRQPTAQPLTPLAKILATTNSTNAGGALANLQSRREMSATGDHVTLWTAEKIVSGALIAIVPLAFIIPCAPMDYLLAFSITIHSHWGIEAIVLDYVRPSVFGPVIPKISLAAVYLLSALTLGGLAYFTYTDVGLVKAIKMLWSL